MRHSIALLTISILGCAESSATVRTESTHPVFDAASFTAKLPCQQIQPAFDQPGSVEHMSAVSDTTLLLFFKDARTAVLTDDTLAPLLSLEMEREGPNGVFDPSDATVLDDAFVVSDQPARKLKALDTTGSLVWERALPFIPDRVLAAAGGIAVFPLHLPGPPTGGGFYLYRDTLLDLGISPADIGDPQMKVLANMRSPVVATGTDRLVVLHQFVTPVAGLVDLIDGQPAQARALSVPLAAGVAERAGWTPTMPYAEEDLERIVAPAIAATGGPEVEEITVLTRTGERRNGYQEKVLLRLDESLGVKAGYVLPFNATHAAYLRDVSAYIILTEDESWHRCTPPTT